MRGGPMEQRQIVLSRLDAIIERLTCLPQDEMDAGWDRSRAETWIGVFRKLRATVENAKLPLRSKNAVYMRGLDMDSITNGRIFDMVVELDSALRALPEDQANSDSGD